MKRLENVEQRLRRHHLVALGMVAMSLNGCVQIDTPDKPIEINLNINIRQEVVFRLDGKAKELVEQNSEIF
ncbi:MAG: YnbE family lipoprotein [Sphingopyxis sp.]|nr:YnbE family lipoprotein [Sphingopyxis sp.]